MAQVNLHAHWSSRITLPKGNRLASVTDAVSAALAFAHQLRWKELAIPLFWWWNEERGRVLRVLICCSGKVGEWRRENSCCRESDSASCRVGYKAWEVWKSWLKFWIFLMEPISMFKCIFPTRWVAQGLACWFWESLGSRDPRVFMWASLMLGGLMVPSQ